MQPNSLIHIVMDSMRFTFNNIKKCSTLAIIPVAIGTVLSVLNFYMEHRLTEVISIILSLIVVIPFTIKWIQLSLGEKVETTYKNSFFWNPKTTQFLFKYIKISIILMLLIIPIIVLSAKLSSTGLIAIVVLALLTIWVLTLVLRMAMILPAFVDGKDITIKTALKKTENTNTAILLSGVVFIIFIFLFLLTFLIIYMPTIGSQSLENNFVILTAGMFLQNAVGILLSATQTTYLTFMYKKIMEK